MAGNDKLVVTGAYLSVGTTGDVSDEITEASVELQSDKVEVTTHGSSGWEENLTGIKRGTLNITWVKDADLSGLDLEIWNRFVDGADLAFELRKDNAAASAANPKLTGNCKVTGYMLGGSLGAALGGTSSFPITGAVTRATA